MPTKFNVTQQDDVDYEDPATRSSAMTQQSRFQNGGEGSSEEAVVEEIGSTGSETEFAFGEEATEADEADNHTAVSNPATSASTATEGGESSAESGESESEFEAVEGWDESQLTEAADDEEALAEAYYADTEANGGQEFFPALGALLLPIAKAVLPTIAGAVVKQGTKALNPRLRTILQRLSRLGINLPKRRESVGSDEATEVDEMALETLERQVDQLEVVIGRDDRVRVANTRLVPWRRICHLKIQAANNKTYLGTGFFVGRRTIITAGHCVYIHGQGGWAKQIVITPGRNAAQEPYGKFTATSFRSVRGWVVGKQRNYDYGAIILPRSAAVSPDIGAFGFGMFSDSFLLSKRLNTAGYPGDKPAGTMWFHGRNAKSVTPRTIVYDIDTAGGQSGSAVWIRTPDSKRIVVGIHTNGAPSGNSATRITRPVFDNLHRWRTEGGV